MKYLFVVLFIIGSWDSYVHPTIALADNILLKNGHVYLNVQVVDTTSYDILYMKQIVSGGTKSLTKHSVPKADVVSIEYKELVNETSQEANWTMELWRANSSLQSIMPNATLVGFEKRRPNMAIALPLGLISISGGLVVVSKAESGDGDVVLAGAVGAVLGVYFVAIAFKTEDWAIYSNGAEIKVSLKLK